MPCDGLRVHGRAAVLKVSGDAGGPEGVAASGRGETYSQRPPFDHVQHVGPRHRIVGEVAALVHAAEERLFFLVSDAGRREVGIHLCLRVVMRGHLVALAAFFMQPEPPALAVLVVVLDSHMYGGAHAGTGEIHQPHEGAVLEAHDHIGLNGVEKGPGLVGFKDGGLATLHHVLGTTHGARGVRGD